MLRTLSVFELLLHCVLRIYLCFYLVTLTFNLSTSQLVHELYMHIVFVSFGCSIELSYSFWN